VVEKPSPLTTATVRFYWKWYYIWNNFVFFIWLSETNMLEVRLYFERAFFRAQCQKFWVSDWKFKRYNTTQHYFFRELVLSFPFSVLSFFPTRQVSEIVLNESSKSTENALIEILQKDITKYFLKSKVYEVSLVISVVSRTKKNKPMARQSLREVSQFVD
jgi:hypothetical protein